MRTKREASRPWWSRPLTWAVLAVVVRIAVLAALPGAGTLLVVRPKLQRSTIATSSAWDFLNRRTDFRPLTEDEGEYDEMARNLLASRGFVLDSQWLITVPGQPAMYAGCSYPIMVASVYALGGSGRQLPVFLSQIILGGLAVGLAVSIATRLAGPYAGAGSGAFACFDPALIWTSVAMMSEALVVPLTALLLWLAVSGRWRVRWGAILSGLVIGILCLARSTLVLPAAVMLGGLALWAVRRRRWFPPAAVALAWMLLSAPWTIRNALHWGRFIPYSTKSGTAAWMHNHPGLIVEWGPRAIVGPNPVDIFSPTIQRLPDEASRDAALMDLFKHHVATNPGHVAGLMVVRFAMALWPMPVTEKGPGAWASAAYSKLPAILALVGVVLLSRFRRLFVRSWPLWAFVATWQVMQTLAGPGLRYRLPAEIAWASIIGVVLAILLARLGGQAPLARRFLRRPA